MGKGGLCCLLGSCLRAVVEKLEDEIHKNDILEREKERVIKDNMMYKTQYTQLESQNRFLESKLQFQTTASSHMCRDHLLWSIQTDPVKVLAAMYTEDSEWSGIVWLDLNSPDPPHGDDSGDPGHQEATVMATGLDHPRRPHRLDCTTSALMLGVKVIATFRVRKEISPGHSGWDEADFFTTFCSTEHQLPATITWVHLLQVISHVDGLLVPCSHLASPYLPHLPGKRFLFFRLYFYLKKIVFNLI